MKRQELVVNSSNSSSDSTSCCERLLIEEFDTMQSPTRDLQKNKLHRIHNRPPPKPKSPIKQSSAPDVFPQPPLVH